MRLQNWQTQMDEWLRWHASSPHAYGIWDCALMAASHLDNITGSELYVTHQGRYNCPEAAAEYLLTIGVESLDGLATQILGACLPNRRMAQRGDVVTFDTVLGPGLGIVDLSGMRIVALDPSETGFIRLPLSLATAAWRV